MNQYTSPLAPAPAWLDPSARCIGWTPVTTEPHAFYAQCVDTVIALGVPSVRACDIVANTVSEVGWHLSFAHWNCGGVKATKGWAERYKARTGMPALWWPAHGNVGTGDSETVFYRGYRSLHDFFDEWLLTFVPKPGTVSPTWLYRTTGERFWQGDPSWFGAMVAAGYKGPVTAKHPTQAITDHASLVETVRTLWAQARLHLAVDGKWGPASRSAALGFQREHGLPATGMPDAVTVIALEGGAV